MKLTRRTTMTLSAAAALPLVRSVSAFAAPAAKAPAEITIGDLRASMGAFASISMPVYYGIKLWADQTNAAGGAYVKAFDKKIPLKLISFDDESNPETAATLTNQLITQDHVDMLVGDSGSVLTAVSVPIAREHKMFLFDPSGVGTPFFTKSNPYIALLAAPTSAVWSKNLANYLDSAGVAAGVKSVAIVFATNDFTGVQAHTLKAALERVGKLKVVYFQGVPTSTSNYTVLINNIARTHPDAVVELGFPNNDIAFLRNLETSGLHFKFVFAAYPGLEFDVLRKAVGPAGVTNVFTSVSGANYEYHVTVGMTLPEYKAAWMKEYANTPGADFGFNAVIGYTSGLVLQEALAHATSLDQLALRDAVFSLSGRMVTISGPFELAATGAQLGELMPVGQVQASGDNGVKLVVVFPSKFATGKAEFGR